MVDRRELASLQGQLKVAGEEARRLAEEKEALSQQNRRFRDDLNTMTQVEWKDEDEC